jgi:hypothetical protein
MFLVWVTFLTAFFVEALGTLVSVKGASSFFGGNVIIIALVLALDIGKIVLVSFAYQYWQSMKWLMKMIAIPMIAVMMVFTSGSAAGFLSGEFQKAMAGNKEVSVKVDALKQEQTKLELRKKQIDDQIANLPSTATRSRVAVMKQFDAEQKRISDRIVEIDRELPTLQVSQITSEAKAGPIIEMAKVFGISTEEAVRYVILLIIFVFDPLAVFLILAGNFMLAQRSNPKALQENTEPVISYTPSTIERAAVPVVEEPSTILQPETNNEVTTGEVVEHAVTPPAKLPQFKKQHTLAELKAAPESALIMGKVKPDNYTKTGWDD